MLVFGLLRDTQIGIKAIIQKGNSAGSQASFGPFFILLIYESIPRLPYEQKKTQAPLGKSIQLAAQSHIIYIGCFACFLQYPAQIPII
ncbi:hypothetical protein DCC85_08625 [Paenibacillus sp. CAA11]|nr:hypothetical protein DCC85_08625 [Paenibacillus sp. CAA11]